MQGVNKSNSDIQEIIKDSDKSSMKNFSLNDLAQIKDYGIPLGNIQKQLDIFQKGIPKMKLVEPATLGNGIIKLSQSNFIQKADFFDSHKSKFKLLKFVPASGAASRMFKFLSVFLNDFDVENETINAYINRKKDDKLMVFIVGMDKFPFFNSVYSKLKEEIDDFDSLSRDYKNYYFVKFMLSSDYFDFANKPKGILPFHKYATTIATPIEEHLYECGYYSSSNHNSFLHFTVSESHQSQFEQIIDSVKGNVENETDTTIQVSYSYQDKSTDTIAVDENNSPFRKSDGRLLFRPGGHGALIGNLNKLDADVIFIKNIDNVILHNNENIALYKKALAGVLVELQRQIFDYLLLIDSGVISPEQIIEIKAFLKDKINFEVNHGFDNLGTEAKIIRLHQVLNRPIRVCGMVKNEGEPGGGPFWVINADNEVSLQIVESSQVDLTNPEQAKIFDDSSHFNPVDLVCGTKNYKNEKFDLTKFVDPDSGFIVEKTFEGRDIKAYELPGLWNGAMANWLTVFVEVPLITFNPVKTVNDLLKEAHQSI